MLVFCLYAASLIFLIFHIKFSKQESFGKIFKLAFGVMAISGLYWWFDTIITQIKALGLS